MQAWLVACFSLTSLTKTTTTPLIMKTPPTLTKHNVCLHETFCNTTQTLHVTAISDNAKTPSVSNFKPYTLNGFKPLKLITDNQYKTITMVFKIF